jgi:predicted PurR-regulated permease PerM
MPSPAIKKPPIVRLPPKSNLEVLVGRSAQVSVVVIAVLATVFALHAGRYVLAPVFLGIVVGLMLGPVATRIERGGLGPALSAIVVVLIFITGASLLGLALAAPLSLWVGRLPQIFGELQLQLSQLREPIEALESIREQLRQVSGGSEVRVAVEEGSPVESVATLAPALVAQVLLFFASLYFFVATRADTRSAILKICFNRRLRWRVAHIFRDVEHFVSQYLLSILAINTVLGIAVGLAMYAIGVSSPALWGALAGLLNFIVYIGPAIMAAVLFAVGLAEYESLAKSLLPPLVYLAINATEGQFVTPTVIGRRLALNPFIVLLSVVFWLWLWGPVGGLIAIPALLIFYAIITNVIPGVDWAAGYEEWPPSRPR